MNTTKLNIIITAISISFTAASLLAVLRILFLYIQSTKTRQNEGNKDDNKKKNPFSLLLTAGVLVVFLWLIYLFLSWIISDKLHLYSNIEGLFGDMVAALGVLFTGLAFAGLIVTLYIQKEEFLFQKTMTAKEMEVSRLNAFENTFFTLLAEQRGLRGSFVFLYGDKSFSGVAGMKKAYNVFVIYTTENNKITEAVDKRKPDLENWDYIEGKLRLSEIDKYAEQGFAGRLVHKNAEKQEEFLDAIEFIFRNTNFKGYVDHLTQICEYVDSSEYIDDKKKEYYIGFLRSRLTMVECSVLFYYALSLAQKTRLKEYIDKYALFVNLSRFDLINDHYSDWLAVSNTTEKENMLYYEASAFQLL